MIEDRKKADNIQRYLFFVQLKLIEGQFSPVTNTKKNTKGICMLRLPEMYYIAAEASYVQGDQEKALKYLQAVRNSRGLTAALPSDRTNTLEKFRAELQKERRKEFWGEGQLWYYYKRKSITTFSTNMTDVDLFTWPIPDTEISNAGRE